MRLILATLVFFGWALPSHAQLPVRYFLDTLGWQFRDAEGQYSGNTRIPAHIYLDLHRNGITKHPFLPEDTSIYRKADALSWSYVCRFSLPESLLHRRHAELVLESLDTHADVSFNGRLLCTTHNMHRSYRLPVKDLLQNENNTLWIRFHPVLKLADSLSLRYGIRLPGGLYPWVRKAAFQFGWDFCPAFIGCGIPKSIFVEAWDNVRFKSSRVRLISASDSDSVAYVLLEADLECAVPGEYLLSLGGALSGSRLFYLSKGDNHIEWPLQIPDPHLWQPNGQGRPYLYHYSLKALFDGMVQDQRADNFGLCTTELLQQPDTFGRSFFFSVNGKPFFAKGANVVPPDPFLPYGTREYWRKLLSACQKAGFNMLRVWGGGVYASEDFMTLCDSLGLLVWHDFPFACSMYPWDDAFLKELSRELQENIRSLSRHPSLALWCGNNEIDEGWHNWGWQRTLNYSEKDSSRMYAGYNLTFNDLIPRLVQNHDYGRPYIPSSPRHGWGRAQAYSEGDCHYWGVWWGGEPFEKYREKIPRFMSEFGFQALPTAPEPELSKADSIMLVWRQRHPRGFQIIRDQMSRYFGEAKDARHGAYLSRCLQTLGAGMAIEAHVRAVPQCMGSLFWQLNEPWPGITWSALDYTLNPKMFFHALQRLFSPVLPTAVPDSSGATIWLSNTASDTAQGWLEILLVDLRGKLLFKEKKHYRAGPLSSIEASRIRSGNVSSHPHVCLMLSWQHAGGDTGPRAVYFFSVPAKMKIPEPCIRVSREGNLLRLDVCNVVLFPEIHGGRILSEWLLASQAWLPGDTVFIEPFGKEAVSLHTLGGVRHLERSSR